MLSYAAGRVTLPRMSYVVQMRSKLLLFMTLLALCPYQHGQNLVYAVSFAETRGSLHVRFPNGVLGASVSDKLAMLRHYRKTEIYSVSMIDGRRSLLFSDEGMNFEITPTGSVSGGKAYMEGVEREWRTAPSPGAYADPPAIYEISLDGSRQFRRLFEMRPNQSATILNSQGTRAAFSSFVDGKDLISIFDTHTWKLIDSWDLAKIKQPNCAYCSLMSFGWLADGHRLFFNLDVVDDEGEGSDASVKPGIYLASEDGGYLGELSLDVGRFQLTGYVHPNYVNRYLLEQLLEGSFVFQDHAAKEGHMGELQPFVVACSNSCNAQKDVPQKRGAGRPYVSPSGKYLAYIEERTTPNYRPEWHLWSQDFRTGLETELFVSPAPNPASVEPNVSLTVLGWLND